MKLKRTVSDDLNAEDIKELRRLYEANYIHKHGPLTVEANTSHNSTILWSGISGYLASGHMDSETAQLFVEAVNALPKLLKAYEQLQQMLNVVKHD